MKTFTKSSQIDGIRDYYKRPVLVGAVQIDEVFRVETLGGTVMEGGAGDYLICGVSGELSICPQPLFSRRYMR